MNSPVNFDPLKDKIEGIIFGAAVGDGVGLAAEFMTKKNARQLYGYGPIKFGSDNGYEFWRDGHRRRWHQDDFTDDTDQMLLATQCLLETGGNLIPQHFAFRLKEWTEIGFPELNGKLACGIGMTVGSCLSHPDFETNPHKASFQVWERKRNLAANGAVMRTSVLGIPFFWDEEKVVANAIKCAKVTHADPRSVFSSVVVSVIIARMLRMEMLPDPHLHSKFEVTEMRRNKFIRSLESGCEHDGNEDNEDLPKVEPKSVAKPELPLPASSSKTTTSSSSSLRSLWNQTLALFRKPEEDKWAKFPPEWPRHEEPDGKRMQVPMEQSPPNESLDTFGVDQDLNELVQDVINSYLFLITDSTLLQPIGQEEELSQWVQDMRKYCCNLATMQIQDLHLDEPKSIGYTFKCLGSALFAFTRKIPVSMLQSHFFKQIITELTIEGGDADTNCAVAGALLGARLCFSNLPEEWVTYIRHSEFLKEKSKQLLELLQSTYSP